MQFLSEAYTTGGPVAILQFQHLSLWNGNDDYFRVINQTRNGCLQFILDFKKTGTLCLFHQESDGNFHVYYDSENFLVLSEIFADEDYKIDQHLPPITQAIIDKLPVRLPSFGGK